ncbi:MAG: FG-GAP-like repeat-containing protein [Deltaproteobacteria bacterium]|nr:FG-GAP-like repeat-containing protein [Myxococcales bacterium]MDP3213230.1 FG-GAP-like repeat-containing protein [Deltaproteobacteria bacterium]
MIGRSEAWWRAALASAVLACAFSLGCSASVVPHSFDAAVSDLVMVDTPAAVDAPVVDTLPVVDTPPVPCDADTIRCGATCVDTTTDVSHCGACNRACEATWSCVMGACACAAGQHPVGTVCVADDAPRPIAPISLGDVTQRRPTLRWALPPGVDGAVVELCRDRACTSIIETLRVTGTSARPTADLPARSTVFWRMRGRVGAVERTGASPTWIFHVPARSASTTVDTSFNPHFDMNGDGFDDIVVGARTAMPGRPHRVGTASVYYGSATWTQPPAGTARTPDRLFEGGPTGDYFNDNFTVAGAGDVNGDGYADLVLGRASADPGGRTSAGTASVFYGSATWTRPAAGIALTPDRLLEGAAAGDYFGHSVAGAGDVNGDGYADLVVGAYSADPGGRYEAGTASVFYGSATWTQPVAGTARTPDRLLEGAVRNAFGFSVAGAGDINGDGYADLAVLALLAVPGESASAASVYHGSATWTQPAAGTASTPDRFLLDEGSTALNPSLASAGDVNGDGYADLVIGAGGANPSGRFSAGKASVYYGSATWTQPAAGTARTPDRLLEGAASGDGFGSSVASAGDVNGDGYADLVVGAYGADPVGRLGAGTASVFYGSATWTQPASGTARTPDRLFEGAAAGDTSGWSVAGAGDVNGDGYADLVVGAFRADPGGRDAAGTASLFYGSATWTQPAAGTARTPDRLLEGAAADGWFGVSVASADDVNGVGIGGLIAWTPLARPGVRSVVCTARWRVRPSHS